MNTAAEQLQGWKEIACYLKRSVRCVQRWERNEKLPVRRHEHAHGVSIYAFSDELEAWWWNESRSSTQSSIGEKSWSPKRRRATRDEAAGGEGRVLDAHGLGSDGANGAVPSEFGLTALEVVFVISFLRLLESRRLTEILGQMGYK